MATSEIAAPIGLESITRESVRNVARSLYAKARKPRFVKLLDFEQTNRSATSRPQNENGGEFARHEVLVNVGELAASIAWPTALAWAEFLLWTSLGLARIYYKEDDHPDTSWCDASAAGRMTAAMEAFGHVVEVRCDQCGEWEHVDSCWGHTGYQDVLDPFENWYVSASMDAANRLLRDRYGVRL